MFWREQTLQLIQDMIELNERTTHKIENNDAKFSKAYYGYTLLNEMGRYNINSLATNTYLLLAVMLIQLKIYNIIMKNDGNCKKYK